MISAAESVCVRAMVEEDLDRVIGIAASLPTAPQWARSVYEAAIVAAGALRRIALVAEVGGALVGFAVASMVGPQAELESIAVAGEAQGRGTGTALLAGLIRELRLAGAGELELEVRESNRTAADFYARAGFHEVGRRRGYYHDPVEDAVLLRLLFS
jgi:[ribosomal protein S18]-alanine N-acetyltransferase